MPCFKFFETEDKEGKKSKDALEKWFKLVKAHPIINLNTMFETMLNLYLVLSSETSLKSQVFISMMLFLSEHGQLEQVMITQVRQVHELSADWKITKEERKNLYFTAAQVLEKANDFTGAFKVYYETFRLIDDKESDKVKSEAERLIIAAIKSPEVINFKEIMQIKAVQDLKKSAKQLFEFLEAFLNKDIAAFRKDLGKMKQLMEKQ